MADASNSNWIEQQAAEYADLVGSFVESVVDSDTDEMVEYQLIWEGGDLGVALTTIENEATGVQVSRVTGKGFPFGIKNVGSGDILLSINLRDTTKMTLDQVVGFLQECDLPATLRFKKMSPDLDKSSRRPSMPRHSQFVVTSSTSPTSPTGSAPPPSAGRSSTHKTVPPPALQRGSSAGRPSLPPQQQQYRSSVPQQRPSELPSAPQQQRESQTNATPVPVPVPTKKAHHEKPVAAAAAPVTPPPATASPQASPVQTQQKKKVDPAPVVAAAAAARAQSPKAKPAPAPAPVKEADTKPELSHTVSKEVEEIMAMGTVSNDLGFDDESSDEEEEHAAGGKTRESEPFEEAADEAEDDAFVLVDDAKFAHNTYAVDESALPQTRQKSSSSVAMLGHYSTETATMPIMPEVAEASGIAFIDNVATEFRDTIEDNDDVSPSGYPVQPSDMRASTMPSSPVKSDMPRESIRMTMDGGAEPMMKSQPIGTLHELCAKGNLRGVVQHLRVEGPDGLITREPNHGQTGLHLAVKSGNAQLVKLILEQFKPLEDLVNLEDDKGNTALHFAATKKPAVVHLLLENGASANVKNSRKLTPLIISVITSRDDNVIIPRMLLKFGANPNDMHESHTVIHTAIGSGLLNIAGALVKAGAKMDVEDVDGKNVFEKLDRKSTKFLISHMYFPPTHITEKERSDCMLCHKKIKFGHRKCNCTHCGRLCCSDCCALSVEMYKFPMGFPGRTRRGAANRDHKRVCKTCYAVFKERTEEPEKQENKFLTRIIGIEWDEVNPNKMAKNRTAGRRGEK
ncbi:Myosin-like protein, partial [Globisporangium splendens]